MPVCCVHIINYQISDLFQTLSDGGVLQDVHVTVQLKLHACDSAIIFWHIKWSFLKKMVVKSSQTVREQHKNGCHAQQGTGLGLVHDNAVFQVKMPRGVTKRNTVVDTSS